MNRARLAGSIASLAVLRVLAFAALDRRPRFGGAEPSDLVHLALHHWGLQGYRGHEYLATALSSGLKPPLYYAGVPLLFAGSETLHYGAVLAVNAAALAVACWAAWTLARRQGDEVTGLWAVALVALLPGIAGRVVHAGTEPLQVAAIGLALVGLRGRRWLFVLGTAAALLTKPNSALLLAGPVAVALAVDGAGRKRLLGAVALGVLPFALWFAVSADPAQYLAFFGGEPTHGGRWGVSGLLALPRWLLLPGLGGAGVALLALRTRRPEPGEWGLLLGVVLLVAAHSVGAHRDPRYLLPALWALAVFGGAGLGSLAGWRRPAAAVAVLGLLAGLLGPLLTRPVAAPGYTEDTLRTRIQRDDLGLAALAGHPALREQRPAVVGLILRGGDWSFEVRDTLRWELYARTGWPVVAELMEPSWGGPTDYPRLVDLGDVSHLLANRELLPDELERLDAGGFTWIARFDLALPGHPQILDLWSRRDR